MGVAETAAGKSNLIEAPSTVADSVWITRLLLKQNPFVVKKE